MSHIRLGNAANDDQEGGGVFFKAGGGGGGSMHKVNFSAKIVHPKLFTIKNGKLFFLSFTEERPPRGVRSRHLVQRGAYLELKFINLNCQTKMREKTFSMQV